MNTFSNPLGGYVNEDVSINCDGDGGDAGGVSRPRAVGLGPGEQNGRCLFGMGAGVPRCVVLICSCGGGVALLRLSNGRASTLADILHMSGADYRESSAEYGNNWSRFVSVRRQKPTQSRV